MSWIGVTGIVIGSALILRMLFDALGRFILGSFAAVFGGVFATFAVAARVADGDIIGVVILGLLATAWVYIQVMALLYPEPWGAPCTLTEWVLIPTAELREWGGW